MGRSRKKARRWLLGLVAVTLAAATFGALWVAGHWLLRTYPNQVVAHFDAPVRVRVDPHEPLWRLSRRLEAQRIVPSALSFGMFAYARGAAHRLRQGDAEFRGSITPYGVLMRIARGYGELPRRITIPEGWTLREIAERLETQGICSGADFLRAMNDPELLRRFGVEAESAEGYAFPDTYELYAGTAAPRVAELLLSAFRQRFDALAVTYARRLAEYHERHGWGPHQVVILASIVEKEARLKLEQPIIAGVFLNRMTLPSFRPRLLQADPTVAYGCSQDPRLASCARFDGSHITRAMLDDARNRYNTYQHEGLPPGPIANPGLGALRAVLAPAAHDYLYFVARGGGAHIFSSTLGSHNRAVQSYYRAAP